MTEINTCFNWVATDEIYEVRLSRWPWVKALVTGKCVGLEFGGEGCVEALRGIATSAGFAFLDDAENYAEWRYMGVEG